MNKIYNFILTKILKWKIISYIDKNELNKQLLKNNIFLISPFTSYKYDFFISILFTKYIQYNLNKKLNYKFILIKPNYYISLLYRIILYFKKFIFCNHISIIIKSINIFNNYNNYNKNVNLIYFPEDTIFKTEKWGTYFYNISNILQIPIIIIDLDYKNKKIIVKKLINNINEYTIKTIMIKLKELYFYDYDLNPKIKENFIIPDISLY